jgi:hypothetical protein
MIRLIDILKGVQQLLHVAKPVLFEFVLFLWATYEMCKFVWTVAFGHEG